MSIHEEPESQLDPTHTQHENDHDLPPVFNDVSNGYSHNKPSPPHNADDPDSDETTRELDNAATSSPISKVKVLDSQVRVEGTQFFEMEIDTQPSVDYDTSPISRRALENMESDSDSIHLSPHIGVYQLLRPKSSVNPINTGFRFGTPPIQNGTKQIKQISGQFEMRGKGMSDTEALPTISNGQPLNGTSSGHAQNTPIEPLPSRGGPAATSRIDKFDPNIPTRQIGPVQLLDHEIAKNSEDNMPINLGDLRQPAKSPLDTRENTQEASLSSVSRQPFVGSSELGNISLREPPVRVYDAHKVGDQPPQGPSQPRRQATSKTPPFFDEAIRADAKRGSLQVRKEMLATRSTLSGAEVDGLPKQQEGHIPMSSCLKSGYTSDAFLNRSLPEGPIAKNFPGKSENSAQTSSDHTNSVRFGGDDLTQLEPSDKHLSDPREVLGVAPSNTRHVSRTRQLDNSTERRGSGKTPFSNAAIRPRTDHHHQLSGISVSHSIHDSQQTGVPKRDFFGSKSDHRSRTIDHLAKGNEPPDSAAMLQMAAILAVAEKEQREQEIAKTHSQELQLADLNRKNAGLQAHIETLSLENQKLLTKVDDFRRCNEKCRTKMNEITRAHKELYAAAKALDKKKFVILAESAKEMDTELLKKKALISREYEALFKEARVKLDDQNKLIGILNRDIENRLLDLQRERGLRESLQRKLENREKQDEALTALLLSHQQRTMEVLSIHEGMLRDVMSTGADSVTKLLECRALIQNIENSETKPTAALIELRHLIVGLSQSVEETLQAREDLSTDVRNAGVEVLAELNTRLELVNEDHSAQQKLNVTIVGLHEENTRLKEQIQLEEIESASLKTESNETKQELQQCRAELMVKKDELNKAVVVGQEEASLRTQLQYLQTSHSIATEKLESATSEMERVKEKLLEQENIAKLAQQETSKLRDSLEESEIKVSSFCTQKEVYIRQAKDDFSTLRLQMERDLQARLAENGAVQHDNISGLRRQVAEATDELAHANRKLQDLERINSTRDAETNRLAAKVSAVATEFNILRDKSRSMDKNQDHVDAALRILQEQITQYATNFLEWSSGTENKALDFVKRCNDIEYGVEGSRKVADSEVLRIQETLMTLQKKIPDSDVINNSIARYLDDKGLLDSDLTLAEWARQLSGGRSQQKGANFDSQNTLAVSEISQVPPSTHESTFQDIDGEIESSSISGLAKKMTQAISKYPCAQLAFEDKSVRANQSFQILDSNRKGNSVDNRQPLGTQHLIALGESTNWEISENENSLNMKPVELTKKNEAPGNITEPLPVSTAVSTSHIESCACLDGSIVRQSGRKRPERIIGPVIPDSQEELVQHISKGIPRLAERRNSTPRLREAKRTVFTTEHTEYSIHTSETYHDMSLLQSDVKNGLRFGDRSLGLRYKDSSESIDSDHESSGLSDPPDNMENFDFTEYLDGLDRHDRQNSELLRASNVEVQDKKLSPYPSASPRPNSCLIRRGLDGKEMKPPKGILKRPNTKTRNGVSNNVDSSNGLHEKQQPPKHKNGSRRSTAKRPLLRTNSSTSGIESARLGSSYNRVVSGNRTSHSSNYFETPEIQTEGQGSSTMDPFAVPSSPAMGQPQRNSKKRTVSGVGLSNDERPVKIRRYDRH